VALGVAVFDLAAYVLHRLKHRYSWLWRLHRMHHSDPELDVTSSVRFHPFEIVTNAAMFAAVLVGFGIPRLSLAIYYAIVIPSNLLQHANIRFPAVVDRVLCILLVTPGMHQTHHSRIQNETDSCFSDGFSIWDRLFGTYRRADPAKLQFGLDPEYDRDE